MTDITRRDPRNPGEILADLDSALRGTADIDPMEIIDEIIVDVLDSVRLAVLAAGIGPHTARAILDEVGTYYVDHYIRNKPEPVAYYAYPGEGNPPVPATSWMYQMGNDWMAVVGDGEREFWWAGGEPPAFRWEYPIGEVPETGNLYYRDANGGEVIERRTLKCTHLIRHAITPEHREQVTADLERCRHLGDMDGVQIALVQLQRCPNLDKADAR